MIRNATRLRHHIHREMMAINGLTADPVDKLRMQNMKSDMKKVTMLHSIGIMKDHGRSEAEIKEMLRDRFFVSADEAESLIREAEQKEAERNEPLKTTPSEA